MTKAEAKKYYYDGKTLTIAEWAAELGDAPITLYKRIDKGWPTWKVLGQPVNLAKRNHGDRCIVEYDGKRQPLSEIVRTAGKPYAIVYGRIQNGWTIERALSVPVCGVRKLYTAAGETHTLDEWADKIGVEKKTIQTRLCHGWSQERALTNGLCKTTAPAKLEWEGEVHSMAEWGRILGLSRAVISLRLKKGWSIGDALTAPLGWSPSRAPKAA